jgi:hypothetical protein
MSCPDNQRLVLVCSSCLRASCLRGLFPCEESQTAGVATKMVEELEILLREHPDFWEG